MSTTEAYSQSQAAILARMVLPLPQDAAPETLRYVAKLKFSSSDIARMNALAAKARRGTLTAKEEQELSDYRHVGHLLERLASEARMRLKQRQKT